MLTLLLALAAAPLASRDRVREADLAAHVQVLASDEYEGRKPGTAASAKTLSYIATAFARAGLRPGAVDGSWFQPVALVDLASVPNQATWSVRGKTVALTDQPILVGNRERAQLNSPVSYVGYAMGRVGDLRGRAALMLMGAPPGLRDVVPQSERSRALRDAGATAVVVIADPAIPWATMRARTLTTKTERPNSRPEIGGLLSAAAAADLLRAAGQDPEALAVAATKPDFKIVPLALELNATVNAGVRSYYSHNVVARLPGTDANGEAVAIIGHWDHLGICRPEGAPDRICNGAVDNASGIAVMIEVAERLARGRRPARDIVFVATTAEETGLLGANAYVASPTVPLNKIVAVLNIDTIAIGPRGMPVSAVNRGNTAIDPLIEEVARRQGRALDADLDANGFINRQDGAAFTRAGVPAVMAGGSFADIALLQAFLGSVYHGPDDEYSDALPLGGAAEDAELHVLLARLLADPRRYRRP